MLLLLLLLLPLLSSLGRNVFLLIIRVVESDAWSVLLIAKQAFSLFFLLQQGDPNSDILSSSSQESSVGVETSREWQPTPLVKYQLRYLKSYLMKSTDGRMSPVRSQCESDVMTISSSSQRYYRKKASQAVDTVLNAIAPRNSLWLLQKTFEKYHSGQAVSVTSKEDILVNRLVTLYNEANSWYTQQ